MAALGAGLIFSGPVATADVRRVRTALLIALFKCRAEWPSIQLALAGTRCRWRCCSSGLESPSAAVPKS